MIVIRLDPARPRLAHCLHRRALALGTALIRRDLKRPVAFRVGEIQLRRRNGIGRGDRHRHRVAEDEVSCPVAQPLNRLLIAAETGRFLRVLWVLECAVVAVIENAFGGLMNDVPLLQRRRLQQLILKLIRGRDVSVAGDRDAIDRPLRIFGRRDDVRRELRRLRSRHRDRLH